MYKVTPPHAKSITQLFPSLELAIDELRWHMVVYLHTEQVALHKETKGETQFHFVTGDGVGHIEAVVH